MGKETQKGTAFESLVARYLSWALNDGRIERRAKTGYKDRGDIAGIMWRGMRVVLECKNHRRQELARWMEEAKEEAGNDGAGLWAVVHKRRGKAKAARQYVTMDLRTFAALLAGGFELIGDDSE